MTYRGREMAVQPSDIPVGTQFSPDLIDLIPLAHALIEYSGDKEAMESAIWVRPVRIKEVVRQPEGRRRSLPLEAAVQYGLLTQKTYEATDLARRLQGLTDMEALIEFVRHIMLRLNGLRLVEMAERMSLEGLNVTADSLAAYCTDQGFNVTVHNTAINTMRMWLARAGVFVGRTFEVDPEAKARVLGLDDTEVAALVGMSPEQRAFAIALCRINPVGHYQASQVRELAESILGRRLSRGNSREFLQPLKDAGFLDYTSGGTAGGKTAELWTSSNFHSDVLEPFLAETVKGLDSALVAYYKRPISEIYADLESSDTFVKGQALEAYAIHIMRLLGLRFVSWRLRAKDSTGGAEVDAVMTGLLGGIPSRWQIQCKNTPGSSVRVGEVAKEVGLAPITKATHILILANAEFTDDAKAFANAVMRESPLTIYLLGGADFRRVRDSQGGALSSVIRAKSQVIAGLQRTGLDWLK